MGVVIILILAAFTLIDQLKHRGNPHKLPIHGLENLQIYPTPVRQPDQERYR